MDIIHALSEYNAGHTADLNAISMDFDLSVKGPVPPSTGYNPKGMGCRSCGSCCFFLQPPRELAVRGSWFRVSVSDDGDGPQAIFRNACASLTGDMQCGMYEHRPRLCQDYGPAVDDESKKPCVGEGERLLLDVRDGVVAYQSHYPGDYALVAKWLEEKGIRVDEEKRTGLFDGLLPVVQGGCSGCKKTSTVDLKFV